VKSMGIFVWTRVIILTLTAVAACGGNDETGGTPEADGPFSTGGAFAPTTGGNAARGGQSNGIGNRTSTTRAASSASCDSALASLGARCPAADQCTKNRCSSQLTTCYGNADANGRRAGGHCQAYTSCTEACNCESSCISGCASQQDQTCRDCVTEILDCAQTSCSNEATACIDGILGGFGGSPNAAGTASAAGSVAIAGAAAGSRHTCADLQACCARLTGTAQTNCQTYYPTASSYGDTGCNLAWSSFGC